MPMPAALKVFNNPFDHNKQCVPANTILFNIRQISQWVGLRKRQGIEGVDSSGTVHRFLEGEDPLHFSTKLFHVKCIPLYFLRILQLPQTARVYLHPSAEEEESEVNSLDNLSTVTITEIAHDQHGQVVVRKLSQCRDELGPVFTIPWNANLQVVAVSLNDSCVLDQILSQRCIFRARSLPDCHFQADVSISSDPNEVPRSNLQAGKEVPNKVTYYNAVTSELLQQHAYANIPGPVVFVPHRFLTDRTEPSFSPQYYTMMGKTESDDKSNIYENLDAPVPPQEQKQLSYPGSPSQSLAIQVRPTEQQLFHHVARRLGAEWKRFAIYLGFRHSYVQQADKEDCFENKVFDILVAWHNGMGNKSKTWATILTALKQAGLSDLASEIQIDIEGGTLYGCTSSMVPDEMQTNIERGFETKDDLSVLKPISSGAVAFASMSSPSSTALPSVQGLKPSQVLSDSAKEPDTAAVKDDKSNIYKDLDAPVPPQEQKQLSYPGSSSQSLAIQVRPTEQQLFHHVARRLGAEWKRFAIYLGFRHSYVQQADKEDCFENKVFDILVAWHNGMGNKSKTWATILTALKQAGLSDLASEIQIDIEGGTLYGCTSSMVPDEMQTNIERGFETKDDLSVLKPISSGAVAFASMSSPSSTALPSVQGLKPSQVLSDSAKEPDTAAVKATKAALEDHCWIPFDCSSQSVGSAGGELCLQPLSDVMGWDKEDTILLEVPPGAVGSPETVEVHYAVIPEGPFSLPEGYQLCSMVVYIDYAGQHVTLPLTLSLPNWYGGDDHIRDGLSFVMASHTLKEGEHVYHFELLEGGKILNNHVGELEISGHCSLFAQVFKQGAMPRYQAVSLQKEEGNETKCDVAVVYASPLWCEILIKCRKENCGWEVSNPSCSFTLSEVGIKGSLRADCGNGWHAVISGSHEVKPDELRYDTRGITSSKLLEMAVNNRDYPPAITCDVTYRKELRETGKPVFVVMDLHILGSETELTFKCKAYEPINNQQVNGTSAAAAMQPEAQLASPSDKVHITHSSPTATARTETAPCNPKEQKPTLKSLDEEVVVRVAGRWETIGVHLDIEDFVLQAIKTPNGSNEDHCHEMFRRWLAGAQGCGPLPRTWSSVLHAVHKGCGSEVCKDITELLHQNE